jgi:hypothetical protein
MLGKTGIGLVVHGEFFAAGFPENANGFFVAVIQQQLSFQPEAFVALEDIGGVLPGKIAFGEAEVMDGIKQVGLAHAIAAANAYNALGKGKILLEIILELEERYGT